MFGLPNFFFFYFRYPYGVMASYRLFIQTTVSINFIAKKNKEKKVNLQIEIYANYVSLKHK